MALKIGPPVSGADFFGRKTELELALEEVLAGNHLSVNAPRRVGKSSFVIKLKELLTTEHKWKGIVCDVEGASSETDFAKRLIDSLKLAQKSIGKEIFELLEGLELKIGGMVNLKLPQQADPDLSEVMISLIAIIRKIKGNFIIVIDELPVFLQHLIKQTDGRQRADQFLKLLRSIRTHPQDHSDSQVIWLFCGSIGLEYFTEKHGIAAGINELKPFPIGAFEKDEALDFLKYLGKKENFSLSEEQAIHIIGKTGWPIPYFLAIIFEATWHYCKTKREITITDIDNSYALALEKYKNKFDTWYSRLEEQWEQGESETAQFLLDKSAIHKDGVEFSRLSQHIRERLPDNVFSDLRLSQIIDLLIHDGYLVKENNLFFFRSPMIRDWWINKRNL